MAALAVAALFGVMAFYFMRNAIELREALKVEQRNNANTESRLREAVGDLIKAQQRIDELESR
ncbi:MAG TPA: hypothetical protein VF306_14125 [Pirellulales bacterium]